MKKAPNLLIILSDQHRYDCVGYSGQYPVQTPHLDRLAAGGICFTNAYTPIPLCCPARQCFLTGRRPESRGTFWNYDILPNPALEPDAYTWPKELQGAGYSTGYIGKWHVHPDHSPRSFGYADYTGESEYAAFRRMKYPESQLTKGIEGEEDPVPVAHSRTHWLADRAIRHLERYAAGGRPWHLRLDFPEPHLPCQPHWTYLAAYAGTTIPAWSSFGETFVDKPYIQRQQLLNWGIEQYTWDDWEPIVRRYYATISQMDAAIGRVLAKLRELGMEENTIVVYSSDHGDMCGGHRMLDKHYILYDDVVRVPLIIRWPEGIAAGRRCDCFVYNLLDLPPTLTAILGLPDRPLFHGRSLEPLLNGRQPDDWRTDVVSTYNGHQFGLYTQRMIRGKRWKYIWNTTDIDELYDLENDPGELRNLAREPGCRPVLTERRKALYAELKRVEDPFLLQPWLSRQLLEDAKL